MTAFTVTSAKAARNARFQRGSGLFVCNSCGRETRDTGHDGAVNHMCCFCWDLAGEDNSLSDNGKLYDEGSTRNAVAALTTYIGSARVGELFPNVLAALRILDESRGIDLSAADLDKKAVTKVAYKAPVKAVQKPSRAKVLKGEAAQLAVLPADIVQEVIEMGKLFADLAEGEREVTVTVAGTTVVTTKARAEAAKAARSAPKKAAPKGSLSAGMLSELTACAGGKPTDSKLGSCMRMHLKMRGYITDRASGALTPEGKKALQTNTPINA
jgi:hypothetical protein